MFSERDRGRLIDIVDNIEAIEAYVGTAGFDAFARDRKTVDATERCLQRITEAVIRIGEPTMRAIAPDLPVHEIRGFGNILRHEYDAIDLRSLFNTVINDLPGLKSACRMALDQP